MHHFSRPELDRLDLIQGFSAALAILGLSLIAWASGKMIRVRVGEETFLLRTQSRSVEGALRHVGVELGPNDMIEPQLQSSLIEGQEILLRRARPVTVDIAGDLIIVETAQAVPENLLQELNLRLLPGDQLWIDGIPRTAQSQITGSFRRISVRRGAELEIAVDGKRRVTRTLAPTVAEALWRSGQTLYVGDEINPAPAQALGSLANASLRSSVPFTVRADGSTFESRAAANTIAEALAAVGISPQGLDEVEPSLSEPFAGGESIRIRRIREEIRLQLEPVPFETSLQPLAEEEIDTKRILDTGAFGVRANQVRIRYRDGEEIARQVEGDWLAREPEPRVVGYGTQIFVRELSTPDGTIEYWRAVEMWATSYSASRAGVSPDARNYGITASGKPLTKGLVAIDRNLIPFGTRMYVPGYGFAEAADTGSGVIGTWIDLGYDDDNYEPWAQFVTVYFLTPIPPASNIVWIFP